MKKLKTNIGAGVSALALACPLLWAAPAGAQVKRDDIVLKFNDDAIVIATVNGAPFGASISGGSATLSKEVRDCVPTFTTSCAYVVNSFELKSSGFDFDDEGEQGTVRNVVLGMLDSTAANDDGTGIGLPAGFSAFTAFDFSLLDVNGRRSGKQPSPSGVRLNLDEGDHTATFIATFGATIEGVTIDFFVNGNGTVQNLPPLAVPVATASSQSCAAQASVTVNASGSSDPEEQDLLAQWSENGVLLAQGATATILLAPGLHDLELAVVDPFGGLDRKSVEVDVGGDVTPPVFTFVPPAIQTASCGSVALGTPVAIDGCGAVSITNDAPTKFAAGSRVVTWTAKDGAGNTVTATQTVTAALKDDPSCCPTGSNIILGNANNNNLVGTPGADCILGLGGQDQIDGGGGNDVISGGPGDDVLRAGGGNDLVWAGSGQDQLFGGAGDDLLSGEDGNDQLRGEGGLDTLLGGQGQDQLYGGDGSDIVDGGFGDDALYGENGDDVLDGGDNNDQCTGGAGYDTMLSCTPVDTLDNPGPPSFPGSPSYEVCDCRPSKCGDCSSSVTECDSISGCAQIVQCVQQAANCSLPHECSALCESGRTPAAVSAARKLASCFGGC